MGDVEVVSTFLARTDATMLGDSVVREDQSEIGRRSVGRVVLFCRIQRGQVSRARQELTGAALALKNGATLGELRCERPQMQLREIPPAV